MELTEPIAQIPEIPEAKELFGAHRKKLRQYPRSLQCLATDSYRAR